MVGPAGIVKSSDLGRNGLAKLRVEILTPQLREQIDRGMAEQRIVRQEEITAEIIELAAGEIASREAAR